MIYKTSFIFFVAVLMLSGCSKTGDLKMWENAPVVATRTTLNGQDFTTIDPSLLKDTIVFPISHFMEEINFIKLDDSDDALIYSSPVEISENYMLVKTGKPGGDYHATAIPCKLFDKTGKFISDIGAIGQGPGEYNLIYSMELNEKNQRIYLMPWQTDKILVYDLTGKSLEPIKLPGRVPKAVFKVDGDKVAVAIIPFPNNPSVAWVQTTSGEFLHEIPSGHFTVSDFSNDVMSTQNTADMDISFWNYPSRVDSLYHFDMQTGKMSPKLTINFKTDSPESHSYVEWPDYYVGNTQEPVYISDGSGRRTEGNAPAFYIVNKKTLKGAFLQIENDYLDGKQVGWPIGLFNKGYYIQNKEPGQLLTWIEEILKSDKVNEKMRHKLEELQNSIDENDNNYILYAKIRK